jgi:hypothetical protein
LYPIYSAKEEKARNEAVRRLQLSYIVDRDGLDEDTVEAFLFECAINHDMDVLMIRVKLLNYVLRKKDVKGLLRIYPFINFDPYVHCKWLVKYATDELLNTVYFADPYGYKRFVDRSIHCMKLGRQRSHTLLTRFLEELSLQTYIIDDDGEVVVSTWWSLALRHALKRKDSHDLIGLLKSKAHLFNVSLTVYDDGLFAFNEFFVLAPTSVRIEYLRIFSFPENILLFAIEEFGAHYPSEWEEDESVRSWLTEIVKNREMLGLEFQASLLEDMLLPFDFVDIIQTIVNLGQE